MKCGTCKKREAVTGKFKCSVCAEANNKYNKEAWKEKKILQHRGKQTMCMRCNKEPIAQGSSSRCEKCLEYARVRAREYYDKRK